MYALIYTYIHTCIHICECIHIYLVDTCSRAVPLFDLQHFRFIYHCSSSPHLAMAVPVTCTGHHATERDSIWAQMNSVGVRPASKWMEKLTSEISESRSWFHFSRPEKDLPELKWSERACQDSAFENVTFALRRTHLFSQSILHIHINTWAPRSVTRPAMFHLSLSPPPSICSLSLSLSLPGHWDQIPLHRSAH